MSVFADLVGQSEAVEILKSAKVSASKILATGFNFDFASMDEALDDLLISNWSTRSHH